MQVNIEANISSVEAVQNSAMGAIILWWFGRGYEEEILGELPLLHLSFLVLPIILHRPSLNLVSSTNVSSGIGKFIEKFELHREDLMAVHTRTLAMRRLSLQAISTGISTGLLNIVYEDARLRANDVKIRRPTERIKPYTAAAEKLGRWMARVPPTTTFSLLRVSP
ncbi:three component ABC system middle component [Azospirillum sp. TSO35-2]|uniref:three component ABC system middle component n=1 Tax=Azospirillum sp. TSO35-2 TaxID=716796 RepID=UPI0011B74853|nr:three component ABC system middle component [Azospirillum sp. TSO35-2]